MKVLIATAMLIATASAAAAQAPSPGRALTLDEALALGRAAAPRVAEAASRVEAAGALLDARDALRLPTVSLSGGYQRTNHVDEFLIPIGGITRPLFPDIPNNYRARADAAVPLYTSGRVAALASAATAEERAAQADAKTAAADVALDIARAYWTLVTARESVKVVEQSLTRTEAYAADVKARLDAGFLPPNDLLAAQAQRARQSVALIQAKNAVVVAQADLCRLIGLDLDTAIVPSTPLATVMPSATELISASMPALVDMARAKRSERESLTERAEALRKGGDAAVAASRPQILAMAGVEESRPNPRFIPRSDEWRTSWEAGVSVTWQVFDGGRARAERTAAAAQATALTRRRDEFDGVLGVELRQRRGDVDAGRAAVDASAELVTAATELRRVLEERFRAGVATSMEVLDAQTSLLEAELERTRLMAALRISEVRLVRAVGMQ